MEASSNNGKSLSEKVGNSKVKLSLFNILPIKEVNVDVIPKTTVIPVRKNSRSETLYEWCFSSRYV